MRILLVNNSAYPTIGGVENSLRFMGRELLQKGHEVKIWCLRIDSQHPERSIHEGIEIIRHPVSVARWPHKRNSERVASARKGVIKTIEEFKPDAVWSRSAPLGLGVALTGYSLPLFQIFCTNARMDAMGSYVNTQGMPLMRRLKLLCLYPFHYISFARIEKELLKYCTPVFFSKNMHDQMIYSYKEFVKNAHIIPPGVDRSTFNESKGKQSREEILFKYNINDKKKKILYVGRLSGGKNIGLLLRAFKYLKSDSILILVGAGPEKERIEKYASKLGVSSRTYFAGQQDTLLPGFYTLADVTVLPTTIESFGQVLIESMSCATPAVGFLGDGRKSLTATSEIIKDGVTGRVVKEINPVALAEGIDSILNLPASEYKSMSAKALTDVANRFTWQYFVDQMLDITEDELSSKRES